MKYILFLLILTAGNASAQNTQSKFDGHNWKAPYTLTQPAGWGIERFELPAAFAPGISYKGVEDLRFMPGWSDPKSHNFWSYAYMWYLDEVPVLNAKIIQNNLQQYYDGLALTNLDSTQKATAHLFPAFADVKKVKQADGEAEAYLVSIEMFDFIQKKPLTLYGSIRRKICPGQTKGFIFFELSPQDFTDKIWLQLDQLWLDFDCH
jgi:hypothetical protein